MEIFLKLKKKRAMRRIVFGVVAVLSLTALIIFVVLKENSKVIDKVSVAPHLSYDIAHYTNDYEVCIMVSALVFSIFVSFLLADFLAARIYFRNIDGEDIIVYNNLGPVKLLINGEEKDVMLFKGYMEAKLKTGVTIVVSPEFFMSYHITFSDNRTAIDL